jgi:hypothetical protein
LQKQELTQGGYLGQTDECKESVWNLGCWMWESAGEHEYARKKGTKNQEHNAILATRNPHETQTQQNESINEIVGTKGDRIGEQNLFAYFCGF